MKVDFHVHSTASDGTFKPTEIAAMTSHYAAVALTDHDNIGGIDDFLAAAHASAWAGVELSVAPGPGFDEFHLLGLGLDPTSTELKKFLKRILDGRNARNEQILLNFRRLGIEMGEEIQGYANGEVLARPHFARWLVEHNQAQDIVDAFTRYLKPDSPLETRCYEERWCPSPEEAFAALHAAGALCVMAHPKYAARRWATTGVDYDVLTHELARLKEIGLDGIEAIYGAHTNEENVNFTIIATKLGLLKSAGSDFHGANKPMIHLGMEVDAAYIAPLLEALPHPV